ncbi:MAG: GGDEF domain-containing protein [Limnohabitans sp.]
MKLDSSTLIFSIGILSLLMAFITWTFQGAIAGRNYGLKTWSVGISCVGVSLILNFLRGELPPLFGILGANVSLMAGGTLGLVAPAIFYRVRVSKPIVISALAVGAASLLAYYFLDFSIAIAMVGVCFSMSVVLVYSARVVYKHSPRPISFSTHAFAISMGVMGMTYFARAAVVGINPNVSVAPVTLAGTHQSVLIFGALFVVCSSMSFYSMVQEEQRGEITERAKRDSLTGLFNRRAFFEVAEKLAEEKAAFSILMIDIDHFKSINDTHGHLGGDSVLAHAGRLIANAFRVDDMACRFGGEEFCVLLRNCNAEQATRQAELLVEKFRQSAIRLPDSQEVRITISAGVSEHVPEHKLLKTIQAADSTLYAAKNNGRNQVQRFDHAVTST